MAGIVVKPRARILHGHDWVFSSEVLKVFGNPADGDVISLKDGKDRLIGSAIYNSKSQIGKPPSIGTGEAWIQTCVALFGAKATVFPA